MNEDSCLAPVWISLPKLPLQCFVPEFLESVANHIGRFLCFDKATSTLARPSAARLCVEIDLRKDPPHFIWVGLFDGFKQQIVYERLPKYCNHCHVIGHVAEGCLKASPITTFSHEDFRLHSSQGRSSMPHQPSSLHPSKPHRTSNPAVQPTETLHQRVSAAATPQDSLLQAQPTTELQQRAPAATEPHDSLLQAQPTSDLQQRDPAAAETLTPAPPLLDAHPKDQPTAALLQHAPAAAAPSSTSPTSAAITVPNPTKLQRVQSVQRQTKASAAIEQRQSNIEANHALWEAVNRQVAILDQARLKVPGVDKSTSLSQQQSVALEQFKNKVLKPARIRDTHLSSPTSVNHFEALLNDHSNEDDYAASYYSDTDDGCVEPIEMGYQSANGRSSNKRKDKAPSSMKINKRHPNMPLHVKLRSRKSSYPSTP